MIGEAVDNLVGVFSPTAKLSRMAAREAIKLRTQYAAAKTTLSTGEWSPVDSKVNTLLANSNTVLRKRARQLVRDMPAMATALDKLDEHVIGTGITLRAGVKDPGTGKLAKAVNQKIEDAWNFWCDEADEAGNLHFIEMQQLSNRQGTELGEYVFIKKKNTKGNKYLPFSLQMVEPDVLASWGTQPYGNANLAGAKFAENDVFNGVEYDRITGQVQAYHFENYEQWKKPLRVPADRVIVGFRTLRPGQLRGVTPLAPVILLAHSLRDYIEAEISTAQKAARWLAFVTSNDPQATMAAFGAAQNPTFKDSAGNQKYSMEFGHAIVDFLQTGEKVDIADHNRPGDAFGPFVKFIMKTFAAMTGVSYELISGDYYDAKYTASRVSRNDMNKGIAVRRQRHVMKLINPVFNEFMDWAVITGKLDLPGYFTNPAPYLRKTWMFDGQELLDPLREGRAEADAMADYRKSPQEILVGRGRDPEQVLDEFQEWFEMLEDRKLPTPEQKKLSTQTNPAQVAGK